MEKEAALLALEKEPENLKWLRDQLLLTTKEYDLCFSPGFGTEPEIGGKQISPEKIIIESENLLRRLMEKSRRKAETFPAEALWRLPNRYPWTFSGGSGSLETQLREETRVIRRTWKWLHRISDRFRLLIIPNETTPTDYLIGTLPKWCALADEGRDDARALLLRGVKIASSEHRVPLEETPEGRTLSQAMKKAFDCRRVPLLIDFSRRRFPRAFLRVWRFARNMGWGINPIEKVQGRAGSRAPGAKSPRGLPPLPGAPTLLLLDPWPISDPKIISGLRPDIRTRFCGIPETKPWQDDRIGARREMEMDENGIYRFQKEPWVVPTLSGWIRADLLFRNLLRSFLL